MAATIANEGEFTGLGERRATVDGLLSREGGGVDAEQLRNSFCGKGCRDFRDWAR